MALDSEELWVLGEPEPPLRQEIIDFLRENSDLYFTRSEISEHALGDDTIPLPNENVSPETEHNRTLFSVAGTFRTDAILDSLVADGLVEKRGLPEKEVLKEREKQVDTENTMSVEEADEEWGLDERLTYYRIAIED